jgi:hypothetical protein
MQSHGRTKVAGEYKAVLELADALHTQLMYPTQSQERMVQVEISKEDTYETKSEIGVKSTLTLPESTLRRRVTKDLHGGSMAYDTPFNRSNFRPDAHAQRLFRDLLRKEAYWIVLFTLSIVPEISLFLTGLYPHYEGPGNTTYISTTMHLILVGFPAILLLSLCLGSTGKSRVVLFIWMFALFCIVPVLVLAGVAAQAAKDRAGLFENGVCSRKNKCM